MKTLRPKVGDRVFRRSPAILSAPFDSLFPTAATFRQLYLDMPHSHLQAGSNRIAPLTIRIKKEFRPSYPLTPPMEAAPTTGMSALPSSTAPTAEPTFAVYFGQHRSPSETFSHILRDDPWEEIYGSVVTVTTHPNGDQAWSGSRFHYTSESGIVCPTQYMVWTLLAYWAVNSLQDTRKGLLCSP